MFAGINNSAVLARGEKKRVAYSKFASDLHHLNAQQLEQPRRAGLGQQASACRCGYACTDRHTVSLRRNNRTVAR